MKRNILKIIILLIYVGIVQFALPIIIDPFNVFHVFNIRDTGIEPNKHYIKMSYILKNPNKFDSFLFGSSKVGAIHTDKIKNLKCYNMTYSAGLPIEHLNNLNTMLKNSIHPKKIFIAVDCSSYNADSKTFNIFGHLTQPLRCPYEYLLNGNFYSLQFLKLYFNLDNVPGALKEKIKSTLLQNDLHSNSEIFYEYGWITPQAFYEYKSKFNWQSIKPSKPITNHERHIPEVLQNIRDIKNLCDENKIELTVFTNPLYETQYAQGMEAGYTEFLKGLAQITEFYNFTSICITERENYNDVGHYRPQVGDIIIDVMCNGKKYDELYEQGFGVKVDRNNVDELIALLEKQWQDYKNNTL